MCCARALGRAGCSSRRLRLLVADPRGVCWHFLRRGLACRFDEAQVAVRLLSCPLDEGARALAVADGCVLFPGDVGSSAALLVPSGGGGVPLTTALTLREVGSCAQARTGEVALSVHTCDDPRRSSLVTGPLRALARGERSTKVRSSTLSGRNRRSLRVSGAMSAVAAGDGLVATARRGSGSVQLWHAEGGALAADVQVHDAGSTVLDMSFVGGLLVTAATDGTARVHGLGMPQAAAHPALPPMGGATDEYQATSRPASRPASVPPSPARGAEAAGSATAGGAAENVSLAPHCLLRVEGHRGAVCCVELCGSWLVTGGDDACAQLFGAHGGRLIHTLEGHAAPLRLVRVALTHVLTACADGDLRVWDALRGVCLQRHSLLVQSQPPLCDVRPTPDGLVTLTAAGQATAIDFPRLAPHAVATPPDAATVAAQLGLAWPSETHPAAAGTAADDEAAQGTASTAQPFPTAQVRDHIRSLAPDEVAAGAPEYMAAVLEYVTADVLQRAGDAARSGAASHITPHHIRQAVRGNADLTELVGEKALEEGGLLRPAQSEGEADPSGAGPSDGTSAPEARSSPGPFPTAHVRDHIRSFAPDEVAAGAPEYMAAVLEYVTADVLQRAGDAARSGAASHITPHHIRQAVRGNADLTELVGEKALEEGGLLRPAQSEGELPAETRDSGVKEMTS